jgi:hypothetical protein
MKKLLLILITLFFIQKGFCQSNSYYVIFVPTHNNEQNISKTYYSQIFYCESSLINSHNKAYVQSFSNYLLKNYDFEGYWHPVTQANSALQAYSTRAQAEKSIRNQKSADLQVIQTSFTISDCSPVNSDETKSKKTETEEEMSKEKTEYTETVYDPLSGNDKNTTNSDQPQISQTDLEALNKKQAEIKIKYEGERERTFKLLETHLINGLLIIIIKSKKKKK